MRTIAVTPKQKEGEKKVIPLDSLFYPKDKTTAVYKGKPFGGRKFSQSVQYRTCAQIEAGMPLQELDYFGWTLEKINRLGERYEAFLFKIDKGCAINPKHLDVLKLDTEVRQLKLAELATLKFKALFESINDGWVVKKSNNPITFCRLLGEKYAVFEGRHRVAILCYKYRDSNISGFSAHPDFIRYDYYYREVHAFIRCLVRERRRLW